MTGGVTATTVISAAAAVIGTGLSVAGSIAQGNAASANASYQAQVARNQAQVMENNAISAEQQADYAGKVGMTNAATESMKGAAKLARVRAGFAANGVDPNTGSAVDVEESQRETGKLNAETVLSDAELKAYGYKSQAVQDRYQAQSLRAGAGFTQAAGQDALTGSYFKAGGTLLSGLSSLPTKWSGGKTVSGDPSPNGSANYGAIGNVGGSFGGFSGGPE